MISVRYPPAFAEVLDDGALLVAILVKTAGDLHVLMLRSEPGFVNWRVVFRVSVPLTHTQERIDDGRGVPDGTPDSRSRSAR